MFFIVEMFSIFIRKIHTIKIPDTQFLFPVSKITFETKEEPTQQLNKDKSEH